MAQLVPDRRHSESSRAPPAPGSHPTCLATPAGFQNTPCPQAQPPKEGQPKGLWVLLAPASTPAAWGPSLPLPPPPQVPCPPASETTALAHHPSPGQTALCPALPLIALPRQTLASPPRRPVGWASGTGFSTNSPQAPGALSRDAAGAPSDRALAVQHLQDWDPGGGRLGALQKGNCGPTPHCPPQGTCSGTWPECNVPTWSKA